MTDQPIKKDQDRRPVETLGLPSHGDEIILAEIADLIQRHDKKQPYSRNTLLRIQDKITIQLKRKLWS